MRKWRGKEIRGGKGAGSMREGEARPGQLSAVPTATATAAAMMKA